MCWRLCFSLPKSFSSHIFVAAKQKPYKKINPGKAAERQKSLKPRKTDLTAWVSTRRRLEKIGNLEHNAVQIKTPGIQFFPITFSKSNKRSREKGTYMESGLKRFWAWHGLRQSDPVWAWDSPLPSEPRVDFLCLLLLLRRSYCSLQPPLMSSSLDQNHRRGSRGALGFWSQVAGR